MARQVFLSFLGTNDYVPVHYQLGEEPSSLLRYIQEAIVNIYKKDLNSDDSYLIYIFCTEKATQTNWLDNGHKKDGNPIPSEGLATRLRRNLGDVDFEKHVKRVDIPEGFNEEEIWQIFSKVYEVLEEEDEITFDVTHSFRSIPLFSTVLFNYARVMKKVEVKKIYYGAFEKLGNSYQVKKMPEEERIAPIIDMTSIVNLQKTTIAASDFMKFGKMGSLAEYLESSIESIRTNQLSKIKAFDTMLSTNRMDVITKGNWKKDFKGVERNVRRAYEIYGEQNPQTLLLDKMVDEIQVFSDQETLQNVVSAIKWEKKYKLIQQAYTITEEYAITCVTDRFIDKLQEVIKPSFPDFEGMDERKIKKKKKDAEKEARVKRRNFISAILGISENIVTNKQFEGILGIEEYTKLRDEILSDSYIQELRKPYGELAKTRNILNHGKSTSSDISALMEQEIDSILKLLTPPHQPIHAQHSKPALLINLCNHPLSEWSKEQLSAAKEKYGDIEDMEFPQISANATEEDIDALVDEYAGKLLEKAKDYDVTVHVMGEMTFTMALVSQLMGGGIRCVASTTTRDTIDKGDGVKEAKFHFVRFREYR